MKIQLTVLAFISLFLAACSDWGKQDAVVHSPAKPRDRIVEQQDPLAQHYHSQVKPILEKRCVVCHGCYDSPCQLKLSSPEGIERGFSPELVYATRFHETAPTRLFIDAQHTQEWRDKGYKSVLNERDQTPEINLEQSVLLQLLAQKMAYPLPDVEVLSEKDFDFSLDREQQCPDIHSVKKYQEDFPLAGMPYGLPNLQSSEFSTLTEWIKLGSPMAQPKPLSSSLQKEVDQWEQVFNGTDHKSQLINRYIYEHLFLGHLYFSELPVKKGQLPVYFRLVRSTTPPGEAVKEIASRRPYDNPNRDQFYYRLRQVTSTILTKTHMPYALNQQRLTRWNKLLYQAPFSVESLPNYDNGSNPFKVFAAIPADARYQFMLDEAEFTIMGFIKGPVCRGQTALNVIQDKFWVFFTDPDNIKSKGFDKFFYEQADNLALPSDYSANHRARKSWKKFAKREKAYIAAQKEILRQIKDPDKYLGFNSLWKNNNNASLTIFRHFDSAVVVRGLQGQTPKTAWIIDYPVLERIHYLLVAGYDVYGSIHHQLVTRLYMDLLRIESEIAFITLLPKEQRQSEIESWYLESTEDLEEFIDDTSFFFEQKNSVTYKTDQSKKELFDNLKERYKTAEQYRLDITNGPLTGLNKLPNAAVQQLAQSSFIIVEDINDMPQLFTLLRHNERSNISTLLFEKKTTRPHLDSAEVFKGLIVSYPEIIFKLNKHQQKDFVQQLQQVNNAAGYNQLLDDYGVRRTNPDFWKVSDLLHQTHLQKNPTTYGLFDYNRLENR
ncbi:fatty acid cis/trans isomerase [Psychromonas aquimarina]|uniref:fatty acid cis/trans isomerase n=1 Tax=Psychromonas aquimarina TaxID=444919 RepID=UPI0004099D9C|nr:fatty acid cis/trans isomerase [Psychromonas aquimarina]